MNDFESIFNSLFIELREFVFEGEFYFDGVLIKLYLLIFFLLFLVIVFKSKSNELDQFELLGYSDPNQNLKVLKRRFGLLLMGVSPKNLQKTFWRNQFEILENIVNRKFIDVDIKNQRVKLFYDNLPDIVPFRECPKLKPMEVWLGKNQFGKDAIINLQDSPAIYVDGKPGSGKTVAIQSILKSFQMGVGETVEVLAVSSKAADYYALKEVEGFEVTIIDPFEGNFEENINEILNRINLSFEESEFKKIVDENEVSTDSMNLGKMREAGLYSATKRKFLIFDEAKDYLSKDKADSKEEAKIKSFLVKAVYTHIRRNARFLSTPIIIASQTQTETDLDIPLKAFHLRIASNTNEAMSKLICGDSRLTDLSFRKGKYFLKDSTQEQIVKIPFA